MTIPKIAYASMLIGLSSLIGTVAAPAAGWANGLGGTATGHAQIVMGQTTQAQSDDSETLRDGLPGRRIGGGTRDLTEPLFAEDYTYLAALVTTNNLNITTDSHPSLMFHIPEMVKDQMVEFVLRDSDDELVYETTFWVERAGGMLTVDMATVPGMTALNVEETYRWYFSIVPDAELRASDVAVHGNVRRVERAEWLAQQQVDVAALDRLGVEAPLMQARMLYQEANLWHDAAVALAALRRANPSDGAIAAEWDKLMEAAGLSAVLNVSAPAVQIGLN